MEQQQLQAAALQARKRRERERAPKLLGGFKHWFSIGMYRVMMVNHG